MDKELKDILLDNENANNGNKKILLFVASLVLIFLIVIIAIKIINTDSEPNNQARLVLPPPPNNDENIIKQPSIYSEIDDENFTSAFKNIQDAVNKLESSSSAFEQNTSIIDKDNSINIEEVKKENDKKDFAKESNLKKSIDSKANVNISKKTIVKKTKKNIDKNLLFIQVFALRNFDPNSVYVKNIKQKGYKFKVTKINNINKVLIGPFEEKEINKKLIEVRRDINKNAFIIR